MGRKRKLSSVEEDSDGRRSKLLISLDQKYFIMIHVPSVLYVPRSFDPFHIESYYIKWAKKTSWALSECGSNALAPGQGYVLCKILSRGRGVAGEKLKS